MMLFVGLGEGSGHYLGELILDRVWEGGVGLWEFVCGVFCFSWGSVTKTECCGDGTIRRATEGSEETIMMYE